MHVPRAPEFNREAAEFDLRFNCEDCAHFDGAADACCHEWPTGLHRRARYQTPANAPGAAVDVVFCKEFELD